jgi:hypothetical protein
MQALHNLDDVHKSMKNPKHFLNRIIGKNRNGNGVHSIKLSAVKMLQKVASLAVYQITAFAFVRDVDFLLRRCSQSPSWRAVVCRLQDEGFRLVFDAHSGHLLDTHSVPYLVRSKVQKSIGYVLLCNFLCLTRNGVANVMPISKREPSKAARKRDDQSLREHSKAARNRDDQSEAPVLQQAVDDLNKFKTAVDIALQDAAKAIRVFAERTTTMLSDVSRNANRFHVSKTGEWFRFKNCS